MGQYLGRWSVFALYPQQVRNPEKLEKVLALEKVCWQPRRTQTTAVCWCLAQAYQDMSRTAQCPQEGKKVSESDNGTPGPAAAPATVTDTVVSSTLMTNAATEAEKQQVLVSLAPVHKQKKRM